MSVKDFDATGVLRDELVKRIRAHPVRDWEPSLLRAVIEVIDLGTGGFDRRSLALLTPPRLQLVKP